MDGLESILVSSSASSPTETGHRIMKPTVSLTYHNNQLLNQADHYGGIVLEPASRLFNSPSVILSDFGSVDCKSC
ncbi:unnamed protein product [Gongylonema pulchrum]|uniref:Ovule protein n=1 Tax=Gongylonema pulchrum TaxID=637853 RepID=A0A183CZG4_9BILA|nr:unnamed protein product [Gongylonema pulchrum]